MENEYNKKKKKRVRLCISNYLYMWADMSVANTHSPLVSYKGKSRLS